MNLSIVPSSSRMQADRRVKSSLRIATNSVGVVRSLRLVKLRRSQNMMVMMLCLIFLSATGLGTLGLVTTILYFRSQSQRRTDGASYLDGSYRNRRRL